MARLLSLRALAAVAGGIGITYRVSWRIGPVTTPEPPKTVPAEIRPANQLPFVAFSPLLFLYSARAAAVKHFPNSIPYSFHFANTEIEWNECNSDCCGFRRTRTRPPVSLCRLN